MTNLILPSRLTKQPQSWIPLDLNHPLLERVVIATTVFDGKLRNLLSPAPGASIGTHASGVYTGALNGNEGMVGLNCPANSLGYINLGAFSPIGSEATLLGLIGYGGSGTSRIFLGTKSGDTGTGIGIGLNTASALNGRFHDTSAVQQSTGTVSRLNGGVFPFALTVRADQGNFYFNNQVATPVSATFDSTSLAGSQNLYVARDGGTYRGARVVMVLALDREVSLPEYQDWMQNPWQIFQPDKRILYFSVGGGATTVSPGSGSITATGYAPSISQTHTVSPAAGAVAALGYAPTIAQPHTVAPSAGAATVLGYAPSIQQAAGIYPGAGAVEYAGQTPTISQPHTVSPGVGAYDILGYAPTVSQAAGVAPLAGSIIVLGYAPAISQPITVAPGAGAAAWLGQPPTISQSTPLFTQEQLDYLLAYMEANMAVPTAAQIAAAVWAEVLEGTLTAAQMQRIKLAALAGKRQGLGTATEEYLGLDGVTPRVTFTPVDVNGNGTTVVDGA